MTHQSNFIESGAINELTATRAERERVWLQVTDNGMGLPKENLTRMFNPGFTTKKDGQGFGLHSGTRELGGSLTVNSGGPGHGATFILELPIRKVGGQDMAPSADETSKVMY